MKILIKNYKYNIYLVTIRLPSGENCASVMK